MSNANGESSSTDLAPLPEQGSPQAALEVRNPATGAVIGSVPGLSADEVAEVAQRLRAAQPAWEALEHHERAKYLLAWLDWIVDHEDHILGLVHREAGKSWGDAQLEIMVCIDVINYVTRNAEKFLADETRKIHSPAAMNKQLKVLRRPYPLVGVITPWNYPVGMPMMDVPGALMAGAAVLSKPSEVTPLAWVEVVRGWEEIGAPPVLACATGSGDTGRAVVENVDYIQFTGSTRTGRAIGVRAAERLIPSSLELGGKDPMVVLHDADLDRAVRGAVWGGLFNAGQSCIAVERIYVDHRVHDRFVEKLVAEVEKLRVGHDPQGAFEADFGAMANEDQMDIVERQVADAIAKGARVVIGGHRVGSTGLFYAPTVLVDVDHTMDCMTEETFGPLLPVMPFDTEQEAVALANDSVYGLGGSVWTKSTSRGVEIGRRIETGGMNVNNALAHVFQFPLPMGGWKNSGLGHRFGGPNMLRKYTRQQALLLEREHLTFKSEPHWYPHSKRKADIVDRLLRLAGMHDWRRRLRRPVPTDRY